ncbi:MAG: BlaI/MecI/CopY family transcriptional regulator [Bacteroidia bacterium]
MAKRSQIKPTANELAILRILWNKGDCTVREVHDELGKEAGYTGTLKLMQLMLEKGLIKRDDSNKSHIYKAAVPKQAMQNEMVSRIIDTMFHGSASQLVMHALGNSKTSEKELEELGAYLKSLKKNKS